MTYSGYEIASLSAAGVIVLVIIPLDHCLAFGFRQPAQILSQGRKNCLFGASSSFIAVIS